jgi:hypothetical protein
MDRIKLPGIIALLMSLALVGTGAVLLVFGIDAKDQVRTELAAENIVTPDDASIPGVPVDSAATALSQAQIIQDHTLEATEGRTWADMDREDPQRPFYLQAASLRTALMSSYLAFKLADLVTGLGALFLALGIGGSVASGLALRTPSAAVATTATARVALPADETDNPWRRRKTALSRTGCAPRKRLKSRAMSSSPTVKPLTRAMTTATR